MKRMLARTEIGSKRMMRMPDDVYALCRIKKRRGSSGVFLGCMFFMSSAELTALKPKPFRNFSVISASSSLFLRVFAGCSGMNRRKEKPPETCLFPVV